MPGISNVVNKITSLQNQGVYVRERSDVVERNPSASYEVHRPSILDSRALIMKMPFLAESAATRASLHYGVSVYVCAFCRRGSILMLSSLGSLFASAKNWGGLNVIGTIASSTLSRRARTVSAVCMNCIYNLARVPARKPWRIMLFMISIFINLFYKIVFSFRRGISKGMATGINRELRCLRSLRI